MHVLAFPCNQFGAQEPGTPQDIQAFAEQQGMRLNEQFWLMEKVDVNGGKTNSVYAFLKQHTHSGPIQWNFLTKFLVQCSGDTCRIERYDKDTLPSQLVKTFLKDGEEL